MLVTFNGTGISLRVVSSGLEGSTVLAGDISQFAGQTGELRIIAPADSSPYHGRNIFMVDYIRISTSPPWRYEQLSWSQNPGRFSRGVLPGRSAR